MLTATLLRQDCYTATVNSKDFKLHLAELLEHKRQEEAAPARDKQPAAAKKAAAAPVQQSLKKEAPAEKKPPAAERYEPKITFRIRLNRHR